MTGPVNCFHRGTVDASLGSAAHLILDGSPTVIPGCGGRRRPDEIKPQNADRRSR
jgi:hypothetical protein